MIARLEGSASSSMQASGGVVLLVAILASVKFQRDSNRAYLLMRDRIGATLSSLQEGLAGVRVIQASKQSTIASS